MIYIIDDNQYNQMSENYSLDFTVELQKHTQVVRWERKIDEELLEDIIDKKACCVLIHESVGDIEPREKLMTHLRDVKNIPYCFFSNGMTATVFENESISSIKKDRLYKNLNTFLQHFIHEGKVDLNLLSLGVNYDFEKAGIIRDTLIGGVIFSHRENFKYESAFNSLSEAYLDLKELVNMAEEESFTAFEDKFDVATTTAEIMRQEILRLSKLIQSRDVQ